MQLSIWKISLQIREFENIGRFNEQVHEITAVYDTTHALACQFSRCLGVVKSQSTSTARRWTELLQPQKYKQTQPLASSHAFRVNLRFDCFFLAYNHFRGPWCPFTLVYDKHMNSKSSDFGLMRSARVYHTPHNYFTQQLKYKLT